MIDEVDYREWSAYKRLNRLSVAGLDLSPIASGRLKELKAKHPDWNLDGSERDEFAIWSSSGFRSETEDVEKFFELPAGQLLAKIRVKAQSDQFAYGGLWGQVTQHDPLRAFKELVAAADAADLQPDEWEHLFVKLREDTDNRPLDFEVLEFLKPKTLSALSSILPSIAAWMESRRSSIESKVEGWESLLSVWDSMSDLLENSDKHADLSDIDGQEIMMGAWNDTPGHLVNVLVGRLDGLKPSKESGIPDGLKRRFETAMAWPGRAGLEAQCCLIQRLPWLDYIHSQWTVEEISPLLRPECDPYWLFRWYARFYHSSIGSKALFEATKGGLLATFPEFSDSHIAEGQILHLVQAALRSGAEDNQLSLTPAEAKQALVHAGPEALRHLTRILRRSSDEKETREQRWQKVIKPVLLFCWPVDAEMRTQDTSRGLLHLALSAGEEFGDAVELILPHLKPWDDRDHWNFDFLFDEDAIRLMARYPNQAITLLERIITVETVPAKLNEILDAIELEAPAMGKDPRFKALKGLARRAAA